MNPIDRILKLLTVALKTWRLALVAWSNATRTLLLLVTCPCPIRTTTGPAQASAMPITATTTKDRLQRVGVEAGAGARAQRLITIRKGEEAQVGSVTTTVRIKKDSLVPHTRSCLNRWRSSRTMNSWSLITLKQALTTLTSIKFSLKKTAELLALQ